MIAVVIAAAAWVLWNVGRGPTDFSQDYFAAHSLLDGESIYGDQMARRGRDWLSRPSPANFHPPTNIPFFLPLAWLPYRWAFVLLGALTVVLYGWSLVRTARVAGLAPRDRFLVVAAL